MTTVRLTKFVCVGLIVALAACSNKEAPRKVPAVGAQSKLGKMLTAGTWCKPSRVGDEGQIRVEKVTFSNDGIITMTDYLLHDDSTLKPETESVGTWSVLDTSLVIMTPQQKAQTFQISKSVREEDGAKCLNMSSSLEENTATTQICPCQ